MFNVYINHFNRNGTTINTEELMFEVPSENGFPVLNPSLQCSEDSAENFSFTMESNSPYYDSILPLKTLFRIEYDGETVFYGRAMAPSTSTVYHTKSVTCEGWFAFLNDTYYEGIQEKFKTNISVSEYFNRIINNHNSMAPAKSITKGTVSSGLMPSKVDKYEPTSWTQSASLISNLSSNYGGHMRIRYEGNTKYLDWYKYYAHDAGEGRRPSVKVGRNILDISSESDVDSIFTRVIPIGDTNSNGKSVYISGYNGYSHKYMSVPYLRELYTDSQLTDEFHNWKDYRDAETNYGIIYKTMTFADADTQQKLWDYTKKWIKDSYFGMATSFTVKAIDFHLMGENVPKILVGECVNVEYLIVKNGVQQWESKKLVCKSARYDLFNPENNSYVFGIPSDLLEYDKHNKKSSKKKSASTAASAPSKAIPSGSEDKELTWHKVFNIIIAAQPEDEYCGTPAGESFYNCGERSGTIQAYDPEDYQKALPHYTPKPGDSYEQSKVIDSPTPSALGVAFKANLIGEFVTNGRKKLVAMSEDRGLFAYVIGNSPYPGNIVVHWYIKKKGYTYQGSEGSVSTFDKIAKMIEEDPDSTYGGKTNADRFRSNKEMHASGKCYDPENTEKPNEDAQFVFNANLIGLFGSNYVGSSSEYGIFACNKVTIKSTAYYKVVHWYQKSKGGTYDTKTNMISDPGGSTYTTDDGTPSGDKLITLNEPITYTDEDGIERTVQGAVSAEDFKVREVPSFKTKFAVVDQEIVGLLKADQAHINKLNAIEAFIENLTADRIVADTYIASARIFTNELTVDRNGTLESDSYIYTSGVDEGEDLGNCYCSVEIDTSDGTNGKIYFTFKRANGQLDEVNFNMADTEFFKAKVSAARISGINSVYIGKGTWSDGYIAFTKMVGDTSYGGVKYVQLSMAPSWKNAVCTVKAYDDEDEDTSIETGAVLEINVGNKLQTKTLTSNGTYEPTGSNIGFSSVTVKVPSVDSMEIGDVIPATSKPSQISTYIDASSISTAIKNNHQTYIWFSIKAKSGSTTKYTQWFRAASAN